MIDLFVSLGIFGSIGSAIYSALSVMMQPLYWVVSGLLVFFHWIWGEKLQLSSGLAWTLAIISLTILVRTLLIPLFVKQINSTRNMQLLQPKIQEIQRKYPGDRERQGQETMRLYREEGVNPAASCFPLLVQLPIFLALFRVLQGAAANQVRGHWLKIHPELVRSLQEADLFGAKLAGHIFPITPFGATQVLGIILVILMVAALMVTQLQLIHKNMTPEAMTGPMYQQQKIMIYVFPVIYALSAIVVPIGVLLYWLASNIWTMVQQDILIRNNPAPNTPAYIDWEEKMKRRGKDPDAIMAQRALKRRGKKATAGATTRVVAGAQGSTSANEDATASGNSGVTRQRVTRSTVRRQPKHESRAKRRKN